MPFDLRTRKLAQIAVRHSLEMKKGEKVILSGGSEATPFLVELYKEVILQGGIPIVRVRLPDVSDFFYKYAKKHQLTHFPDDWFKTIKDAQCYVGVSSERNTRELTSADSKKVAERSKLLHPISDYVCNTRPKMRRVTISYPSLAQAQDAEMSLTEYENFVYDACLIDWKKFGKRLDKINNVFEKAKEVHLIGDGVDLKLSIMNKNCVADKGEENMPGGEVFMAPVRNSLNGWINFDYPRIVSGKRISGVKLKFEKGKIVHYDCDEGKAFLGELLKSDENASYIGELGIGCNPKVKRYTNDLLFDEKMDGTIHLALGMAYKQNGGGNDSAIHVDIVKDMKKARIVLDGKVVQDKGKWKI
jgi:aminopeptidase